MAIVSIIILFLCLVCAALMFQRFFRATEVSQIEAEAEGDSERVSVLVKQKMSFRVLWIVYMVLSAAAFAASFYIILISIL